MEIRVPQLAEGVNSGTVVSVLVSEGDEISKDQTLLELETEKAVAPIPSDASGKIEKILVKEGDAVSVGQVIITLGGGNGKASSADEPKAAETPKEAQATTSPVTAASSKTVDIHIPQLAEGVNSGTVVSLLVGEGDKVSNEQTLLELETEKAVAPIPSTVEGTVSKVHVAEGDSVNVGQVIFSVSQGGGAATTSSPPQQVTTPAPKKAPLNVPAQTGAYQYVSKTGSPPPASPSIRKMAKNLGIDLTRVKGSEHGGRITADDMRAYIASLQQGVAQAPVQAQGASPQPAAPSVDFSKWGSVKKEKMTLLRKKISEKMLESWTTIPHVTQFDSVDITDLLALRKKYKDAYEKKDARLTVTSFVFKAMADALKRHPIFNCSMDEQAEEIVYKNYYHLGLAVDTEQGLIVPVIRDVDQKDLVQISKDIVDLATRTRDRKLGLDEMKGGTFTVSNQGGLGGAHFTPIINKPEVAILGVGQASEQIIPVNGKPEVRMIMPITLSYDHRLIDGGKAAVFIKDYVEALGKFSEESVKL